MRHKIIIITQLMAVIALGIMSNASAESKMEPSLLENKVDKRLYEQMPNDIVLGNDKAPVTIVEYSSLSCPHCAHFQAKIFPGLQKTYIDTGKAKFIHRDFPLDEPALRGAILAHCADKDRYYTFIKVLFDKQDSWAYQKNYLEVLTNIGKLGGMSGEKIDACMKNKTIETSIIESKLAAAKTLDIKATPTFFINGEKVSGVNNVESFAKIIDKKLAPTEAAQPAKADK
jgi:protein-disulfide isomerase